MLSKIHLILCAYFVHRWLW